MPPKRGRGRPRKPKYVPRSPLNYRKLMANAQPIFTETWQATPITLTAGEYGGTLTCTFTSIPQSTQYSTLYRQFRILRNQWILIPRATVADYSQAIYNAGVSQNSALNGRFVYAINDTASAVAPTSEIEVLTDNGAKILMTARQKPIKISHKPVPLLNISSTGTFTQQVTNKYASWLNTDSPEQTGSGTIVPHSGVSIFVTVPTTQNSLVYYDVYCKTTFQMKDPA